MYWFIFVQDLYPAEQKKKKLKQLDLEIHSPRSMKPNISKIVLCNFLTLEVSCIVTSNRTLFRWGPQTGGTCQWGSDVTRVNSSEGSKATKARGGSQGLAIPSGPKGRHPGDARLRAGTDAAQEALAPAPPRLASVSCAPSQRAGWSGLDLSPSSPGALEREQAKRFRGNSSD